MTFGQLLQEETGARREQEEEGRVKGGEGGLQIELGKGRVSGSI